MQRLFDSAPVVPVEFSDFSDDEVDVTLRDRTLAEGNEVEFKSSFWDTSKIQHDLDEFIESVEPLECLLQRFWEDAQERLGIVVVCCHVSPFWRSASAIRSVTLSYSPKRLNKSRSSVSMAISGARKNELAHAS